MSADQQATPHAPQRDQPGNCVALLIIDMINRFDFSGAQALLPSARKACATVLELRRRADDADVPVIYVNDNFGLWHSERSALVHYAGDRLIHPEIAPRDNDYFVIKPKHSGFYATNLPVLLPKLGVSRLILSGVASDICILFTAADAAMRDYALWVPSDAVAAEEDEQHEAALRIIADHLGGSIETSTSRDICNWR